MGGVTYQRRHSTILNDTIGNAPSWGHHRCYHWGLSNVVTGEEKGKTEVGSKDLAKKILTGFPRLRPKSERAICGLDITRCPRDISIDISDIFDLFCHPRNIRTHPEASTLSGYPRTYPVTSTDIDLGWPCSDCAIWKSEMGLVRLPLSPTGIVFNPSRRGHPRSSSICLSQIY